MDKELTIKDIMEIAARDESRVLELKQSTGELYKAMTSACAFLNTDGGWLFFGVTPKLQVLGQNVTDPTRQELAMALRKIEPAIDIPAQYVELEDKPGFYVIALHFPAHLFSNAPFTFDGKPYYKVENTTSPMPREMFEERLRMSNPKRFSWENRILDEFDIKDLDVDRLYAIIQMGVLHGRIPGGALAIKEPADLLTHMHLSDNNGNLLNAVNVLFGKAPTKYHIQCKVRLARFEGTGMMEFRDQTVCYGNLFEQYDAIVNFCQKHLFLAGKMEKIEREDTLTVPFKALRESVLNLLVHRCWDAYNLTPSVAIYDDRIEFQNPGHFPIGNTYQDFIEAPHSSPINPVIADVFYRSGLMEAWGRGITSIFAECESAGMPKPEFRVDPHFVTLIVRFKDILSQRKMDGTINGTLNDTINGTINETLNADELAIVQFIVAHPGVQVSDIMTFTGKSMRTVKRYIARLVELSVVERRGSRKTGGYYKKGLK